MSARVVSLAVAFAWAMAPSSANACGHGGGGGGGGGHGGGRASSCVEVSGVVGHQRCTSFGRGWDVAGVPSLFFEAGLRVEGVDLAAFAASGTATHLDANHAFSLRPGDVRARAPGFGAVLRVGTYVYRARYVGAQLGFTMGAADGVRVERDGLSETPQGMFRVGAGAFGGVRLPAGPVSLRAEVLVGADVTGVSFASRYGACEGTAVAASVSARVEPRLSVEASLGPWTSLGLSAGTNALSPQDWNASLYLRWSLRAYDAR